MDVAVSLTLGSKARWNASVPTTPTATSATAATIARIFFMARFLLDGNRIKGQDTTDARAPVLRQRAVEKAVSYTHLAFPYRPDDELQAELIDAGALAAKAEGKRGTIVVITSDGYSFFLERNRAERERVRREKRDARLIGLSALFAALCVVAGFLLGRFLA